MAYLDYFASNINIEDSYCNERIVGKCCDMCPEAERYLRIKEGMVHILEKVGKDWKLVKSFCRSAADANMAKPISLRPFKVLIETVQYLLLEVSQRSDVSQIMLYEFIYDRLRSVRQDMTIQRMSPEECTKLLEPMIRFHVYYGYKLCDYPIKDYDPVLNKKALLECIKLYLSYCDTLDKDSNKTDFLSGLVSNIKLSSENKKLACDRVLIESLYILCNLDDVHPIMRYYKLKMDLRRHPLLHLAYSIAIEVLRGNLVRVVRLTDNLCPLTLSAFYVHLPILQKRWLEVLNSAYSSKQVKVPTRTVAHWLMFDSDARAQDACRHYGLKVEGDSVHFSKADFRKDSVLFYYKYLSNNRLDENIHTIFTYETKS